jgi:hypothetical protein
MGNASDTHRGQVSVFLAMLAAALVVNLAAAVLLKHAGLQTGLWDLHFWAVWPVGHGPSWMPVNDSWMPMRKAWEWVRAPHHGTLYQEIFFHQHVKFQYPPSSLLVFALPEALHIAISDRLLNWIGWLAVIVEAAATGALVHVVSRGTEWARRMPRLHVAVAMAAGLAVFSFHSVLWAFSLGQIQAWLNAAFALAALAYCGGRQRTAGALIGVICLIKPQFALFALWAALRGKRQFLAGLAVVVAAGLAMSLAWFGWTNHVDYLSAIAFMNRHGEAYYPNSAVNGVMNRLLGNDDPFTVDKAAFPPFHPLVYYVGLATSVALIAFALLFRRKRDEGPFGFLAAAVVFTIASPIAWTHHLGILPPVFAFLAVTLIARPHALAAAVLGFAYLASAIFIPPLPAFASGVPSLVYALPLAGAIACLWLLSARSVAAASSSRL